MQQRDVINGHPLWMPFDFGHPMTDMEAQSVLYRTVVEGGLGVCKICGAAEIELDVACTGKRPERPNG